MAIVRAPTDSDNINYLATVALFCGISCTILMLKFRGFKASLNLASGKRTGTEHYELAPQTSVGGAYRTSRYEYYGNVNYSDPPRKITPSMVKLPPNAREASNIKPSRSTGDLSKVSNAPADLRKSTPNVAANVPTAAETSKDKNQLKEQKRLEKERLSEQKKREKLAAQERDKQEKLRKEREKQDAQQTKQAKEMEKPRKKKASAPQPNQKQASPQKPTAPQPKIVGSREKVTSQNSHTFAKQKAPPQPNTKNQPLQPNTSTLFPRVQYSTNTMESSISRSSGPPPYSDVPQVVLNERDGTGNTSFVKPVESSSWDLISQHRQEMSRTAASTSNKPKQTHLDLHYNVGNLSIEDKDNSEA